jgi:site-specific recombinase XerD
MSIEFYFKRPCCLARMRSGPLGAYIDQYGAYLQEGGFPQSTGQHKVRLAAYLSRWLDRRQLCASDLDEARCEQFLKHRARTRIPNNHDRIGLRELLAMLRAMGVISLSVPVMLDPCEQVVQRFRSYLLHERGLSTRTARKYPDIILVFLRDRFGSRAPEWSELSVQVLVNYVQGCARRQYSLKYLGLICTALRSFLNYLVLRGQVSPELVCALPTVWNWKFTMLPRYLSAPQVRQVLNHCDRSTWIGMRDYAILLLLARLGLRANEVCTLTLDDIDWRAGQLTINAKGGSRAQMPLPADVGQAIASYLQIVPRRTTCRRLFLRELAPHVGLRSPNAISCIVAAALQRAGVQTPFKGAHVFRHTLATQMLQGGASLEEIGHLLRHRSPDTTRIYAKVDLTALHTLALPWPGGVQ